MQFSIEIRDVNYPKLSNQKLIINKRENKEGENIYNLKDDVLKPTYVDDQNNFIEYSKKVRII